MRNLFCFPDGTEVFSGVGASPAIRSVSYTASVCAGEALDYGSACAAMVEATLIDSGGSFTLTAGSPFTYWQVAEDGSRTLVGHFLMESPRRPSPNVLSFTAYDRMILSDVDLTRWLNSLPGWPYTMARLLELVCGQCGLTLCPDTVLVNGEHPVRRFVYPQVTGRQLLRWIAGANAAWAYITAEGELAFGQLREQRLALSVRSASLADYATAPIERVVLRQSPDDIGVAWPENSTGETYAVTNPLLGAFQPEELLGVAENIAKAVLGLSYTPGKVCFFDPEASVEPGVICTVTDRNGRQSRVAAFSVKRSGGISTVESAGSRSRESAAALAARDTVAAVQGRVAEMKASLEEVSGTLSLTELELDTVKRQQSELTQRADSLRSRVSAAEETVEGMKSRYSALEQTADSLQVRIVAAESALSEKADREDLAEVTERFFFTGEGLTISNSATGMGISVSEQRVAFTGGTDPTTTVTPNEMTTTNLSVGSRMNLGAFSLLPRTNGNLSLRYTGTDN